MNIANQSPQLVDLTIESGPHYIVDQKAIRRLLSLYREEQLEQLKKELTHLISLAKSTEQLIRFLDDSIHSIKFVEKTRKTGIFDMIKKENQLNLFEENDKV